MFKDCISLKNIDLSNYNTKEVILWVICLIIASLKSIDASNLNTSKAIYIESCSGGATL